MQRWHYRCNRSPTPAQLSPPSPWSARSLPFPKRRGSWQSPSDTFEAWLRKAGYPWFALASLCDLAPRTSRPGSTGRLLGEAPAVKSLAVEHLPEVTNPDDGDEWAGRVELILAPVSEEDAEEGAALDMQLQEIAEAALERDAIGRYHLNTTRSDADG